VHLKHSIVAGYLFSR